MRGLRAVLLIGCLWPTAVWASDGMPRTAFLAEMRVGAGTPIAALGGLAVGSFIATPSLLFGARLVDRLHVGIGFNFLRVTSGSTAGNTDFNEFNFVPTIAVDIVKSPDDRVAFYGKFGLPLGALVTCPNTGFGACDNGFVVGFDIGVGARYAFHRMFALGLEAGADGSFFNPQRTSDTAVVNFYGALVASFFYGH